MTTSQTWETTRKRDRSGDRGTHGRLRADVWHRWKHVLEIVVKDVSEKEGGKEAAAWETNAKGSSNWAKDLVP